MEDAAVSEIYDRLENGVLRERLIDNGDGTGELTSYNLDGTIISVEQLTGLSIFSYPPLDTTGALATLLVVLNLVPLADASAAIHEEPEHLIAEAEAWSLGGQ
jgi:hypothetical protein